MKLIALNAVIFLGCFSEVVLSQATFDSSLARPLVPNTYIVEYETSTYADALAEIRPRSKNLNRRDPEYHLHRRELEEKIDAAHIQFRRNLFSRVESDNQAGTTSNLNASSAVNVTETYSSTDLFVGATVEVQAGMNVSILHEIPGVKKVYPARMFSVTATEEEIFNSHDVIPQAVNVNGQNSITPTLVKGYDVKSMIGVDKVHALDQGYGQGIFLAIIDTGVDYNHPAFGGGFGPGYSISYGYDFVGDNYDGSSSSAKPGPYPMDCLGHGTHVAGLVAGNHSAMNFLGNAPQATVGMYRVAGCVNAIGEDKVISALIRSYNDGANVFSLSLGSMDSWSVGDASGAIAQRITDLGSHVVAAQGNNGDQGLFSTSSPSASQGVFSVGSVDNAPFLGYNITASSVDSGFLYYSLNPFNATGTLPVVSAASTASVGRWACNAWPANTNFAGSVILVARGNCALQTKMSNVLATGASSLLIYNDGSTLTYLQSMTPAGLDAAFIDQATGQQIAQTIASGTAVTITFPASAIVTRLTGNGNGLMSSFSNFGPTSDLMLKPQVLGPGGSIISTYPLNKGGYAVLSGTSMATPLVSSALALFLSLNGKGQSQSSTTAEEALQNTARGVPQRSGSSVLSTVAVQGGGLIDVYAALHTSTSTHPAQLMLNDTEHLQSTQSFVLYNTGSSTLTYTLSHIPAPAVYAFAQNGITPVIALQLTYDTSSAGSAQVSFASTTVTVNAGSSVPITFNIQAPSGLDATRLPIYSGYMRIVGSDNSVSQVCYMGAATAMRTLASFDRDSATLGVALPVLANGVTNAYVDPTAVYTVNRSSSNPAWPQILLRFPLGSAYFTLDLLRDNSSLSASASPTSSMFSSSIRSSSAASVTIASSPTVSSQFASSSSFSSSAPTPSSQFASSSSPSSSRPFSSSSSFLSSNSIAFSASSVVSQSASISRESSVQPSASSGSAEISNSRFSSSVVPVSSSSPAVSSSTQSSASSSSRANPPSSISSGAQSPVTSSSAQTLRTSSSSASRFITTTSFSSASSSRSSSSTSQSLSSSSSQQSVSSSSSRSSSSSTSTTITSRTSSVSSATSSSTTSRSSSTTSSSRATTLSSTTVQAPSSSTNNAPVANCPVLRIKETYCQRLTDSCVAKASGLANPWSQPVCIAAAICIGSPATLRNYLVCKNAKFSAASQESDFLDYNSAYARIVGSCAYNVDGCPMTTQNFIDLIYGQLSQIGSDAYPSSIASLVSGSWDPVTSWTAAGSDVPYANLQDWLKYYKPTVTTTDSATATATVQPVQCSKLSDDASCNALVDACMASGSSRSAWQEPVCFAASTCVGGADVILQQFKCLGMQVDTMDKYYFDYVKVYAPAVGKCAFAAGGCSFTAQNYVDFIYSQLDQIGSTSWPSSTDFVISKWWAPIASWTGFSSNRSIPYTNLADWLKYQRRSTAVSKRADSSSTSSGQPQIIGNVASATRLTRNDQEDTNKVVVFNFNGVFSNGTTVRPGSYRLLARSLRIFGDQNNPADYDTWTSPIITIV